MKSFRKTTGHQYAVTLAGHTRPVLLIGIGPTCCGQIMDGVSFSHSRIDNPVSINDTEGSWVMSFDDLEAIYLAAKEAHESDVGKAQKADFLNRYKAAS